MAYIDQLVEMKKKGDRSAAEKQNTAKSGTQTGNANRYSPIYTASQQQKAKTVTVPEELSPIARLRNTGNLDIKPVTTSKRSTLVKSLMDPDFDGGRKREQQTARLQTTGPVPEAVLNDDRIPEAVKQKLISGQALTAEDMASLPVQGTVHPTKDELRPQERDAAENIAYNVGAWLAPESANSGNILNNLRYPIARLVAGALGFGEGLGDFLVGGAADILGEGAYMLGANGAGDIYKGASETLKNSNIAEAFREGVAGKTKQVDRLNKFAGDIYENAGQLIPNILTGQAVSGATGLAADGVSKALIGITAGESAAQEARGEGASDADAAAYGLASGLLEATIESISGGIPGLGEGATGKLMNKLKNSPATVKWLADVLGEGGEEALSTVLTPMLKRMTYDPNAENATAEEILYSALQGSAFSAITQAGSLPQSIAEDVNAIRSRGQNTKTASVGTEASGDVDVKTASTGEAGRLDNFTDREVKNFMTGIKNKVLGHGTNLVDFVQTAISDKTNTDKLYLGKVSEATATTIKMETGLEVNGFNVVLPSDRVRHIFKHHGDTGTETARGQIAVTPEDFFSLEETISDPDKVYLSEKTDRLGRPVLMFEKDMGNILVTAQAVTSGRQTLSADTLYIVEKTPVDAVDRPADISAVTDTVNTDGVLKNPPLGSNAEGTLDPEIYVQNGPLQGSDNSISNTSENVNSSLPRNIGAKETSNIQTNPSTSPIYNASPLGKIGPPQNLPRNIGAKEAEFGYTEKVNQQHSTQSALTEQERQMQGLRPEDYTHRVVTDTEARAKAQERLDFDFEGEMESLRDMSDWDKDDTTAAHLILRELIEQARDSGDYSRAVEWNNTLTAHQSAQGQALQANRQFVNSPETIIAEAAEVLEGEHMRPMSEKKKADVLKKVGELADSMEALKAGEPAETAAGYIDIIRQAAKQRRAGSLFTNKLSKTMNWALEGIKTQGDLDYLENLAASSIRAIATDYKKTSIVEGVKTFRRNAMLSKASTIMRNLVANNVFDPVDSISNNVAVPLDMLLSKFTKTRSVAVDKSWLSGAKRQGSMEGLMRSIVEVGLDIDGEGRSKYEMDINRGGRTFKMSGGVFSKLMSTWTKWEGYFLQATDEFQKGGVRAESQRGIDQLYDRGLITDDSLRDAGQQEALYRTFQDDTAISRAMLGVRKGLNSIAIKDSQGGSFGLGDAAIPFAQVPSNLGARAIEYSPVGLVKSTAELVNVLKKAHDGTLTAAEQAKAVKGIGRGLNGSALIAAFAWLTSEGLIHVLGVGDDEDEDAFAMAKSEGLSGTQFNLDAAMRRLSGESAQWQDGDSLMSIDFLEPLNALMTVGALISEDMSAEDMGAWDKLKTVALNSLSGAGQSVLDLPMMGKFQDIYDSFRYSKGKNDGEKIIDAALTALAADIASFVPNALKGVAQGMDDTVRDTYGADNIFDRTVDSLKAGIPWLRQTLPAKLDNFGQERKSEENPLLNALNNNILPGRINTYRHGEVSAELERISEEAGTSKAYPDRKPPNSITYDSEKYDLTPEQRRTYQERAGQLTYEIYQNMMSGKSYGDLTTEKKLDALSTAKGYAREFAQREVLRDMGVPADLSDDYSKAFEAINRGVDAAEFFVYDATRKRFDFDGSGQLNVKEFAASLKKSRMPASSQSTMWAVYKPDWVDKAADAGVGFNVYTQYKVNTYGVESDKDENGKAINGSKKAKIVEIIDGMEISSEDKDALYREAGYSEKDLWSMPWRVR